MQRKVFGVAWFEIFWFLFRIVLNEFLSSGSEYLVSFLLDLENVIVNEATTSAVTIQQYFLRFCGSQSSAEYNDVLFVNSH